MTRGPSGDCLDDAQVLALIEQRMTRTARDLAFVHLDACRACLELVTALLRCLDEKAMRGRPPVR